MELQLRGVSHAYEGTLVLQDINLRVRAGRIVCIVGPSGCGKSTLLRLMGGLEKPIRGSVTVQGETPPGCLNPLTYVFQDFALLPWRSVTANVSLVLEDQALSSAERQHIIDDVLRRTRMLDFRDALPRQLSGGMKQRVAIARALAVSPAVLLMDEPLSALDSQTRELLLEDLIALWSQAPFTAVYVTHNLAEAVRLGHEIIVLSRRPGRLFETISIDVPLRERNDSRADLVGIRRHLWQMMRNEAEQTHRELVTA
jgi:NitT/TauT family transport system ATP-binding protein